jgi:hypothetical protein
MKKSIFNFALALLVLGTSVASANAFMGGRQMTPDRFAEFKAIVTQSDTFEAFQESMKTIREEHKADRENMKDSITHAVELLDNGVVKTITSDDAEVVAKIQSRHENMPKRDKENVTHTVENIDNGVKITITSDDPELVEKIQKHSDKEEFGKKRGGRRGMEKGEGMDGRFEKAGVEKPENWEDMEREDRQEFMQENEMGRKHMRRGGEGRQHPSFRGNRRGGQGENMNGQRKENLRQRFSNWMGR